MRLTTEEQARFDASLAEASAAAFEGWDFAYMERYGGNPSAPLEWSYEKVVRDHLPTADTLLDMGTGGGEFLASLQPLPAHTVATEAYPPNVGVARRRLTPLGVEVVALEEGLQEDAPLPFDDATFDLVINRHDFYESKEVYRVLKPGGTFITQQVGFRDHEDLRLILGTLEDEEAFPWALAACTDFLRKAGFSIAQARESVSAGRFYDIRALVYLVKVLPWVYPDFDVDRYRPQLRNIYIKIVQDGYFDAVQHRFFVIARKEA